MRQRCQTAAAMVGLVALVLCWPAMASAQGPTSKEGIIQHNAVAPARTFACGVGFTATTVGVSDHGNIARFESPAGAANQHIFQGGFEVCYTHPTFGPLSHRDFGSTESAGWGAPFIAQPNGPSTFPLIITRLAPGGLVSVQREINGNTFTGAVTAGNPTFDGTNGNGVGCDSLQECGNCGNRTIHVITRIFNHTGVTLTGVGYQEFSDFDIQATAADDFFVRTDDSILAVHGAGSEDARKGMLLQTIVLAAVADAFPLGGTPTGCATTFGVATPTALGDFEGRLRLFGSTVAPGGNTGNTFRVHYRRF